MQFGPYLALSYGRIAKIAVQLSNGLVNSAMGQIPCSTHRISSCLKNSKYEYKKLTDGSTIIKFGE